MRFFQKLIGIIILIIGVYMIATFIDSGWATPPVLSGLAFTLLGIRALL